MGASGWSYFVPYQQDLGAALDDLRHRVFDAGDYWWEPSALDASMRAYVKRPATVDELFDDEWVQETGTHSILDMSHVLADGEEPDFGSVTPVTRAEALRCTGVELLTREHVDAIKVLANRRWFGRCAVLHDAYGAPTEIYFWGFSGD